MPASYHYDVGGVPGLHVALTLFPPSVERRLFQDPSLFPSIPESQSRGRQRHAGGARSSFLPAAAMGVCNAVVDSGFHPPFMVQPSYALPWTYAEGARFSSHFDSRYVWGETVCGINLGAGGVM
ncbi:hypothetical protein TeGR_g3039, partial [Tetraparma gracilis]